LTFGDKSKDDDKFKEETLPPAALQSLKETQIQAITRGSPGKEQPGDAAAGALEGSAAGGGSANSQIVLPRHRGAVERYFDRPSKGKMDK
jgi:hypothetical protein